MMAHYTTRKERLPNQHVTEDRLISLICDLAEPAWMQYSHKRAQLSLALLVAADELHE